MKNQEKIEAKDGLPVGIDSPSILMGFGEQVWKQNRAKSNQKSLKKVSKKYRKRCVLE